MSAILDQLPSKERRGFARMFAEEAAPYMREAVAEFMGQNGEQHRQDHIDIREFLIEMKADREERKELLKKVKQQVIVWFVVTALSGIGYLAFHWLTHQ